MNTSALISTLTSPFAPESAQARHDSSASPCATAAQSAAVLRFGAQYRRERMDAADMISTDEAAAMAGTTRVTINAWIKSGRCIGVANLRRGFKLPRWQFEPAIWPALQPLAKHPSHSCVGLFQSGIERTRKVEVTALVQSGTMLLHKAVVVAARGSEVPILQC